MARRLLVDGYNVIHADPDLARLAGEDLELARARLIERLAEYSRVHEMPVTAVFDGAGGASPRPAAEDVLGVSVMFSAHGQSADAVLEALVGRASAPRDVVVATSDRATQEAVFSRGALRMSARELVAAMQEEDPDAAAPPPRWRATVADRLDQEVIASLRALAGGG